MYEGKKVLIVDDSPLERQILKNIVLKLGFIIVEAENGETGIKMAIEHHPDLIIMDIVMPGINGFQATKQINGNFQLQQTPIIMCSSKNEEMDKKWGAKQGAKAYVVKPVNEEILIQEIKTLLT